MPGGVFGHCPVSSDLEGRKRVKPVHLPLKGSIGMALAPSPAAPAPAPPSAGSAALAAPRCLGTGTEPRGVRPGKRRCFSDTNVGRPPRLAEVGRAVGGSRQRRRGEAGEMWTLPVETIVIGKKMQAMPATAVRSYLSGRLWGWFRVFVCFVFGAQL